MQFDCEPIDIRLDQYWCCWCGDILPYQRFDKRLKACSKKHSQARSTLSTSFTVDVPVNIVDTASDQMVIEEHITGFEDFDTGNDNEIESEDDTKTHPSSLDPVPRTPSMFIQIFHHPHSGKHAPTIINLNSSLTNTTFISNSSQFAALYPGSRPGALFRTRSDFEFIKEVVTECLRPKTIDKMLNGYHGSWAKNISLTVQNHKDVTLSLAAARKFGIENFNYPKHHSLVHLPEDLRAKGVTENYSTCRGEGFQQEVQQAYDQMNFHDIEPQVVCIDENQEVIACIRMYVDLHDKENQRRFQELDKSDGGPQLTPTEG
ncbi:hypothetical protein M422DRAFT_242353 [Sphaerobolus stellatus SS14]|nr:hypothetical protein M422DRAFT_242353 [Sphaerobolus stellatus SS14]